MRAATTNKSSEEKRAMKVKPKAAGSAKKTFTQEERAAIQERAREVKADERRAADKAGGESELLAKIAEMQESDRVLAKQIHGVVKASAPALTPTTWYAMPAYARTGKLICS